MRGDEKEKKEGEGELEKEELEVERGKEKRRRKTRGRRKDREKEEREDEGGEEAAFFLWICACLVFPWICCRVTFYPLWAWSFSYVEYLAELLEISQHPWRNTLNNHSCLSYGIKKVA